MINKFVLSILVLLTLVACDGATSSKVPAPGANATGNSPVAALVDGFPQTFASLPRSEGGACGFDQSKVDGDNQFVSGWAAISAKDGSLAEAIVIGVSINATEKFAVATKQKREDVAKYYTNPALLDSGFNVYLPKANVPTGAKLTLYQVFQGHIYSCTNISVV